MFKKTLQSFLDDKDPYVFVFGDITTKKHKTEIIPGPGQKQISDFFKKT